MFINDFSVTIRPGQESESGHVTMEHGQQYAIHLRNSKPVRCDAKVSVDGNEIGTFRLEAYGSATLERPVNDTGKFTFYLTGTPEARQGGLFTGDSNNGLIEVVFTPELEKQRPVFPVKVTRESYWEGAQGAAEPHYRTASYNLGGSFDAGQTKGMREGGTALSGVSNQQFVSAGPIEYDYSQQTTITLRLVGRSDDDTPRPLRPVTKRNPVPRSVRR